jgi:uncharacterized protein involved in exopolysaccharide biosynthesis
LTTILYTLFKNKAVIGGLFFVAVAVSLIYCFCAPPLYRAETRLLVNAGRPHLSTMEQYRPEGYRILVEERAHNMRSAVELLKGQHLTETVIARLPEQNKPVQGDESATAIIAGHVKRVMDYVRQRLIGGTTEEPAAQPDKRMVGTFLSRLHVTALADTDLISIAFDWPEPHFAALAANLYAEEYVTLHNAVRETQRPSRLYSERMDAYEKKLRDVQGRIQSLLARTDTGAADHQKQLLLRHIGELTSRYDAAVIELIQSQTRFGRIREMTRQDVWVETSVLNGFSAERQAYLRTLDNSYLKLKSERERMARLGNYWEVGTIDGQLAGLRKQKADSLINMAKSEVALAKNKKASLLREIAAERKKLEEADAKTALLKQLEEEKETAEQNYQAYRKKVDELRIADEIESASASSIKIVAPAAVPLAPAYPDKGLIVGISALVALLVGLIVAALRECFNRTFKNDRDVGKVLGVPLLLSVPLGFAPSFDASPLGETGTNRAGGVRRLLTPDFRRPVATGAASAMVSQAVALAIVVVLCLGGLLFYLHATSTTMRERLTASRAALWRPAPQQRVSLALAYPLDVGIRDVEARVEQPADRRTSVEELEKQRSAVEAELQGIKTALAGSSAAERASR